MTDLRKKYGFKKWMGLLLAFSLLLGSMAPTSVFAENGEQPVIEEVVIPPDNEGAGEKQAAALAAPTAPALLITEMVPKSQPSGTDLYEFVEVYNTTDQPIDFKDYYFYYNNKDVWAMTDPTEAIIIPSHQAVVFWIMNGTNNANTAEQFQQNYAVTGLQEGVNLFRVNGNGGMANTAARNLRILAAASNAEVSSATYEAASVAQNKGIFFKLPAAGSTVMQLMTEYSGLAAATPGSVMPEQTTPSAVDPGPVAYTIAHKPAATAAVADLEITATVTASDEAATLPPVELLYKTPAQARYTVVPMAARGNNAYSAVIPKAALVEQELSYQIRVDRTSESYEVPVEMPAFDPQKAPALLVTELVPNTANVDGTSSDAYEFIEIYNNTDQAINFNNYKIYYRYPDKGVTGDVKWPSVQEDFTIPAQQSVVFWIKNTANSAYKVEDFNAFYGTSLVENQNLFVIASDGMSNSGRRAVVIKTNTEREISGAYYDADTYYDGGAKSDETKADKALVYRYPADGSTTMLKMSSGLATPTPGTVTPEQIPAEPVHVVVDTVPPTIEDLTGVNTIDQAAAIDLKAFAADDHAVTSVKLYLRSDKTAEYTVYNVPQDYNDTLYHVKLSSADLIGKSYIEYYFMASDDWNDTKSAVKRITVTGGPDKSDLRLNLQNNAIINGIRTIKGTAQNAEPSALGLSLDGKELTETFQALEHDAYFVFDAKNVDYYFKNTVTMGLPEEGDNTILHTFMDPIPTYTTLTVPISSDRLVVGSDNVIYIRAGSKSSPFDPRPEENKDDFEIKNVRLMLADGTELRDPLYADPAKELKMGDSAGKHEWIGFRFDLPAELFRSKSYTWDTKSAQDGQHTIVVSNGAANLKSQVTVDNTPPTIVPSVEEGKTYRGKFVIDAAIDDALAGVAQASAQLDGKTIDLPYDVSSGVLSGGNHVLTITATDKVGNAAEKSVTFQVPDENPLAPELVAPANGKTGVSTSPALQVKVEDPTKDAMKVTFLQGFKYDANRKEGFKAFKNASDTEPPKTMIPAGEQSFTADDYDKIKAVDGQYMVNESVEQFPYQRFEVELDPSVKATDAVEIEWQGGSLEGRKVSLYAWSHTSGKWELLQNAIAGAEDFALKAAVQAGDYAKDRIIQVLVQDEIAALTNGPVTEDPYDFSFVWMSDTQYYSESFPYIYRKNVQWIAENKENLKLQYVIHTGDIVDKSYQEYQWEEADRNMKVLEDADIPYGVLAGNHDVGHQNNDYTSYWKYFGEERFENMKTFGGSYQNNRGHYDLVSAGGNDFIIVYMGWGLADEEIQWMNDIVAQYPERKAILALHEFLLVSGNRAPIADKIYEQVIVPNPNVIAALSGHYHDAQLKVDEIDDDGDGISDRSVYQMLADYQGAPEGGLGYIRLMQFDMENNMLHIKTYSPYLDDYNFYDPQEYPGKDEFSLPLDLQPKTKRVATDYIGVKVYTDKQIAVAKDVQSGAIATGVWNGLTANSYYQWYVKAEDANSGSVLSDIWGFQTGSASSGGNGGNGGNGSGGDGNDGANNGGEENGNGGSEGGGQEKPDFNDITGHWALNAIDKLAAAGLINGFPDGSFKPEKQMTRAEYAAVLSRMLGLKETGAVGGFTDVPANAWYSGYVQALAAEGIIAGFPDGSFLPNKEIKREEAFVLLYRAMKGKLETGGGKVPTFADNEDISDWALEAVQMLAQAGVIQGGPDGKLNPRKPITRAEIAKIASFFVE